MTKMMVAMVMGGGHADDDDGDAGRHMAMLIMIYFYYTYTRNLQSYTACTRARSRKMAQTSLSDCFDLHDHLIQIIVGQRWPWI